MNEGIPSAVAMEAVDDEAAGQAAAGAQAERELAQRSAVCAHKCTCCRNVPADQQHHRSCHQHIAQRPRPAHCDQETNAHVHL